MSQRLDYREEGPVKDQSRPGNFILSLEVTKALLVCSFLLNITGVQSNGNGVVVQRDFAFGLFNISSLSSMIYY